jgi:capsular exopolysaccharide synthesis family protein
VDLRDLLGAIRRFWLLALTVFALAVVLGCAAAFLPTKKYTTTATVVGTPATRQTNVDSASLDAVRFLLPTIASQVDTNTFRDEVQAAVPPELWRDDVEMSATTDAGTSLVRVSAVSESPQTSQVVATAAAEQLVQQEVSSLVSIQLLDPAELPTSPSSPKATLILFASIVLGLIAAVLAPVCANAIRRRVRTSTDVRRRFGIDVLGEIPRGRRLPSKIFQIFSPHSNHPELIEAFQRLQTNVEVVATGSSRLAFTSCNAGEGKSTVAAGLAWALASMGERVVVVDADLRRPNLHEVFGLDLEPGLADVPRGADVRRLARTTELPTLRVITAGQALQHPATIIHDALPNVLDAFDDSIVLIDTPPMLGAAETTLVSTMTKSVLMVVDARHGDPDELEQVLHELDRAGAQVLGVVLNRARVKRSRRLSPYYYEFSPPEVPEGRRVRA